MILGDISKTTQQISIKKLPIVQQIEIKHVPNLSSFSETVLDICAHGNFEKFLGDFYSPIDIRKFDRFGDF